MCLSKKSPITNCVAIPGRPPSLYSGAISPSMNSQSILPASCTSSCLMLMIWSSRARNRSADPVVSCFFGRIASSDAATESCFSIRGNRKNEFASFQGLRHANLAISSQQSRQKTTLAQWVRNSSRATSYSSKDKTAADAACAVLERAGIRCWIAPRDIRPGQEYGHAIIEAIDQCRVMVLIFSANANDSRQIHREIERAVSKGVPIIPLRIEEVIPTRSMEYFLGGIHWLDALTPLEKHLQQLAEAVKALLQIDVAGPTAPLRDNCSQASSTVRHAEPAMQGIRSAVWLTGARRLLILVLGVAAAGIALLIGGVWHYLMREPAAVTASAQAVAASLSRTAQSGIKTE